MSPEPVGIFGHGRSAVLHHALEKKAYGGALAMGNELEGVRVTVFEGELDPLDSISDQVFIVRNELGVKL